MTLLMTFRRRLKNPIGAMLLVTVLTVGAISATSRDFSSSREIASDGFVTKAAALVLTAQQYLKGQVSRGTFSASNPL